MSTLLQGENDLVAKATANVLLAVPIKRRAERRRKTRRHHHRRHSNAVKVARAAYIAGQLHKRNGKATTRQAANRLNAKAKRLRRFTKSSSNGAE